MLLSRFSSFFFFNDTATTEIYTLSLHDALPIFIATLGRTGRPVSSDTSVVTIVTPAEGDRKSTRLNSSHGYISYAVFCLKKKKKKKTSLATPSITVTEYETEHDSKLASLHSSTL